MTRIMSHTCSTYSTSSGGVAGSSTTPAFLPSARIFDSTRCRWIVELGSACTKQMIGAGVGKRGEIALRLDDHQMNVEGLCGRAADRLQHDRPDGDVRNETAVHHIDMDPVGAGGVDGADFFT